MAKLLSVLCSQLPLRELRDDEQGIAYVEYITLIVGVSLGALGAVIALGPPLHALYRMTQVVLLFPLP